jgi:hypothetical protein
MGPGSRGIGVSLVDETNRRTFFGAHKLDAVMRRNVAVAALLLVAPLLVRLYAVNPHLGILPETVASGLTALSLTRDGNAEISEYFPKSTPGRNPGYAQVWRDGRLYGIEPIASPLTFAPFFLPYRSVPALGVRGDWDLFTRVSAQVATLTVVLLGLWLLCLAPPGRALLATGIIALATCFRTINGAGLWQHTSGALWLVLGVIAWTGARSRPALYPAAAAALALATACRPILVPAALMVCVDALRREGTRRALVTLIVVAAIGGGALYANWYFHGSLLGGRAEIVSGVEHTHRVDAYFELSPSHYLGLLLAPSRGLFVYSPVLLFALPGLVRALRDPPRPPLREVTIAGLLVFLLYGWIATWWGGWVFGPRYMADLMPFFALWLVLAPPLATRTGVVVFAMALAWSIAVQQLGAMAYPCGWNQSPTNVDLDPGRLWAWHDTEIARCIGVLTKQPGPSAARQP